jgi:hypothetical protein
LRDQAWWLMPIILAIWEVEIKRLIDQDQLRQKFIRTISTNKSTPVIPATQEV